MIESFLRVREQVSDPTIPVVNNELTVTLYGRGQILVKLLLKRPFLQKLKLHLRLTLLR